MKKVLIVMVVIALAIMLAFPSILFAEEGDVNSTVGVREQDGTAGQYILGDRDNVAPDDTIGDSEGDGDTEVFCIDGDTSWDTGRDEYTLTDIDVSDELIGEEALKDDDDKDGTYFENEGGSSTAVDPHQVDGVIDPVEAEAIEILSKEATGATSVEDQESVWLEAGDNISNRGDAANKTAITEAVEALATEFIELAVNNDGDTGNDKTLDEFLADEKINEVDVTVEQDSGIFTGDAGEATAMMENPLVPTITDEGKDVYWYILGGAFNISFSQTELVMEAKSLDGVTNATLMTDKEDDNDGEDGVDNDGDGELANDHYGIATINYYYFDWGLEAHPAGTMGVDLYAWVDVDEDGLFDIVDIDPEKAADGEDPDGDVVGDFQDNFQVVQVEVVSGETVIKTDDGTTSGDVVTEAMPETAMDIHKVEGGKVVIGHDDLTDAEEDDPMTILPISTDEYERGVTKQRFSTLAYTEPFDDDPLYYGSMIFKVNENNQALAGAVFEVRDNQGNLIETITSDSDGYVSTAGLEWTGGGTSYYVQEVAAPGGYYVNSTVYEVLLSGIGVSVTTGDGGSLPFTVSNARIPLGSISLNKSGLDSTDIAGFTLYDSYGNAVGGERTVTGNGSVSWSNLPTGTYRIAETTVPSGYVAMSDITGIEVLEGQLYHNFSRDNLKTPPGGGGGGEITVLGLTELPFTGYNPIYYLFGLFFIIAGGIIATLTYKGQRKEQ